MEDPKTYTITENVRYCVCGAPGRQFIREVVNDGVCGCCGHYDEDAVEYEEICPACRRRNPETTIRQEERLVSPMEYVAIQMAKRVNEYWAAQVVRGAGAALNMPRLSC